MHKKISTAKKGFTIIEVVLVLAVAGLIFLMVFVAVPNMQRGQRDTQRREDMGRLYTQVTNFLSNNKNSFSSLARTTCACHDGSCGNYTINSSHQGTLTANNTSFCSRYIVDNFDDPDGNAYAVTVANFNASTTYVTTFANSDHRAYILLGASCSGEKPVATTGGSSSYAVFYVLEGSGAYCNTNF